MTAQNMKAIVAAALVFSLSAALLADAPKQPAQWARKLTQKLPETRVGGTSTTKAPGINDAALYFIAPKTTGLSVQAQPKVYWYVSKPVKRLAFTFSRLDTRKTLVKGQLKDVEAGMHCFDLAAILKKYNQPPLEANEYPTAEQSGAPKIVYIIGLNGEEPTVKASMTLARVKAPAGLNIATGDSGADTYIQKELWFDAVQSLAVALDQKSHLKSTSRDQLKQLLAAEEVLRNEVMPSATDQERKLAQADESAVFEKLSLPDPIDIRSNVPDLIDSNE